MKNILYENMRRFRTKNLQEQQRVISFDNLEDKWPNQPYPAALELQSQGYEGFYPHGLPPFHHFDPKDLYRFLSKKQGYEYDRNNNIVERKITPKEIASVLKYADGIFNDSEAYIQSAFDAIENKNILNKVFQILKRSPNDYLSDVFGSYAELKKDYHGNGKIPTIMDTLNRLGVSDQID